MEDEKQNIFNGLRFILSSYVPPLSVKIDESRRYDIYGTKPVQIGRTKKKDMFFAFIIIQKYHVGFYFSPIYTHKDRFDDATEELLHLLKGKSCFHIKRFNAAVFEDIRQLMDKGIKIYEEEGWV
ncbi:hypothetical protein [Methanococcoides burtonii]|uniref:DUF1801 domain-containing protein n=1 Tax=Methanococcoides burtonii (strain DSM 6242 / NBRC 107633 / OCM 468 / ACE-M) TaxID=259564 RepID=Q12YN6_METBU|nr:hypothetical protein [Methanococcoides burtonii]ABE51440.1 Hypothetical protein Mbur_0455 [Methanococcoides burtonii DSM 6242]